MTEDPPNYPVENNGAQATSHDQGKDDQDQERLSADVVL
jgi:hypothetical protein